MKSIFILLLFSFLGSNICQSQTVMQGNDSTTYSLRVDFIETIDFYKNDVIIKLNHKGMQEVQSVNFKNYGYFMIDSCTFEAWILPYIMAFRPQVPIVYEKDSTIVRNESIRLSIWHLKVKEMRKYKRELRALRSVANNTANSKIKG